MKNNIIYIIMACVIITSCANSVNEQEEFNVKCLKQSNSELKKLIGSYDKDYYNTENMFGIDESYFSWQQELNLYIKQLESEDNFQNYDSLVKFIESYSFIKMEDLGKNTTTSKLGREILINRILIANLEVLMSNLKAQRESNFQVNTIKLAPVNYDVQYEKTINLDVELVFRNWFPKEKIIYNHDTIQIDSTSRNKNIFRLKVKNPKKGLNEIIVPFYCSRWGEEFIDSIPIIFNVK